MLVGCSPLRLFCKLQNNSGSGSGSDIRSIPKRATGISCQVSLKTERSTEKSLPELSGNCLVVKGSSCSAAARDLARLYYQFLGGEVRTRYITQGPARV